jgi:hypothetical protein
MLLTFGHGTASAEQMTGLLRGAGVAGLIDVRTAPGSRRHPHVARAELERWQSLWWRCHRRLLADFVCVARAMPVRHLMHDGRLQKHRLSPGLRLRDDGLLAPAGVLGGSIPAARKMGGNVHDYPPRPMAVCFMRIYPARGVGGGVVPVCARNWGAAADGRAGRRTAATADGGWVRRGGGCGHPDGRTGRERMKEAWLCAGGRRRTSGRSG